MRLILVHPELFMEQIKKIPEAAGPLVNLEDPGTCSGISEASSELLSLASRLRSLAAAYDSFLQSDIQKASVLIEQLEAEDQQMGVLLSNG